VSKKICNVRNYPNLEGFYIFFRGNIIPMEYNVMDRIVKFGEGLYRYDNRGLVVQNAREERFHYNAKGLLVSVFSITYRTL
jgi:hypothetical protein